MTDWRKRVNIKAILEDDALSEPEQAAQVLAILKRHPEFANEVDGMLIEEMEDCVKALAAGQPDAQDWFNAMLTAVYDIADAERIWMGP